MSSIKEQFGHKPIYVRIGRRMKRWLKRQWSKHQRRKEKEMLEDTPPRNKYKGWYD